MVTSKDTELYRQDEQAKGRVLSAREREELAKRYLPTPPTRSDDPSPAHSHTKPPRKRRIRPFLARGVHLFVHHVLRLFFSIYIRLRLVKRAIIDKVVGVIYYHHRTPELIKRDIKALERLPEHLSVILHLRSEDEGGIGRLVDEVAEIAAWTASAEIPMLSVYERSGVLKSIIPSLHSATRQKLTAYFGPSPHTPYLKVIAPHHPSYSPSSSPALSASSQETLGESRPSPLTLLLLSESDGRDTLVDLTRTLTEMVQSGKISTKDISQELIDAEISETTRASIFDKVHGEGFGASSGEPDLLIIFGPTTNLDGYPPWQVRLTEIFCTRDGIEPKAIRSKQGATKRGSRSHSNLIERSSRLGGNVEYQGFLRALWRFAGAEMRFGR